MEDGSGATQSEGACEMFQILKANGHARLGTLALPGKKILSTPHYLGNTSRGIVPHITQDTFTRDTAIDSVYVALEDFIERAGKGTPPVYNFQPPGASSTLRRFISLPEDVLLVLGARRSPPVAAPAANGNTNETVSVCTAVGFIHLRADDYALGAESLGADIVVALGDIPYERALASKRIEKATDRNIQWLEDHISVRRTASSASSSSTSRLFASLLPVTCARQQYLVDAIADDYAKEVSGLAIFSLDTLSDLPDALQSKPRIGFTTPASPHAVLEQISRGIDVLVVPFVNAATDAGIALEFEFPVSDTPATTISAENPLPLGLDVWSTDHAVDLSPLGKDCTCYACRDHHRAYIHHLVMAKEMTAWVLVQIHNHHVIDLFFGGIRASLARGTFDEDVAAFSRKYESQLPEKTGQGPRARGYQFKSEGPGEPKKNPAVFTRYDGKAEKLAEAPPPSEQLGAAELQAHGFATAQG